MSPTITQSNADQFSIYTTYFVKISGDPVGTDTFMLGTYRVHVARNQVLEDSAGAAIDLIKSRCHFMDTSRLHFQVYDANGVELSVYCDNMSYGIYGHYIRMTDPSSHLLQSMDRFTPVYQQILSDMR